MASTTQLVPTPSPWLYYNYRDNNSNAVSSWLWSSYYMSGALMHYLMRLDCPGPQMGTSMDRGSWPPFLACRHQGRSHLPAPEPKKHCHHYSVDQSYPTLSHTMDCSAPGFPVQHHLPEFAQNGIKIRRILLNTCQRIWRGHQ